MRGLLLLLAAVPCLAQCTAGTRALAAVNIVVTCHSVFSTMGSPLQNSGDLTVDKYIPAPCAANIGSCPWLVWAPGGSFSGTSTLDQLTGNSGQFDYNNAASFALNLARYGIQQQVSGNWVSTGPLVVYAFYGPMADLIYVDPSYTAVCGSSPCGTTLSVHNGQPFWPPSAFTNQGVEILSNAGTNQASGTASMATYNQGGLTTLTLASAFSNNYVGATPTDGLSEGASFVWTTEITPLMMAQAVAEFRAWIGHAAGSAAQPANPAQGLMMAHSSGTFAFHLEELLQSSAFNASNPDGFTLSDYNKSRVLALDLMSYAGDLPCVTVYQTTTAQAQYNTGQNDIMLATGQLDNGLVTGTSVDYNADSTACAIVSPNALAATARAQQPVGCYFGASGCTTGTPSATAPPAIFISGGNPSTTTSGVGDQVVTPAGAREFVNLAPGWESGGQSQDANCQHNIDLVAVCTGETGGGDGTHKYWATGSIQAGGGPNTNTLKGLQFLLSTFLYTNPATVATTAAGATKGAAAQ